MESIIRSKNRQKITLADFYDNIRKGKDYPGFYRNVNFLIETDGAKNECLILEALGKGGIGFVFLAYFQRKLTAVKMTCESQENGRIFSTVRKIAGPGYRDYFLSLEGETLRLDSFYPGEIKEENKYFFDRPIFATLWEPADAALSEKLDESFANKLQWFRHFLKGLAIIHSRDRAHFDIKLDNLFLVGDQLKIADFEFYAKIGDFIKSGLICGTPGHIAPEMFYDRENITPKVDIFSAGIAFANLFTGHVFLRENGILSIVLLTPQEEREMEALCKRHAAGQLCTDYDFRLNYKIFCFYKDRLNGKLESSPLPPEEKPIYHLLLQMIAIEPGERPTVNEVLNRLGMTPVFSTPVSEPDSPEPQAPLPLENSVPPFARMLRTHDRREVIKYCLVPDLLEKLREDRVKEKIMGVQFNGGSYEKRFFSFPVLKKETSVRLFGKKLAGKEIKKGKEWNLLVIVDYWNRVFQLGLEKECDQQYIKKLLDGKTLDKLDQGIFQSKIKSTTRTVCKLGKKIMEAK